MMVELDTWKNAPLWDADSIATATKTWFDFLGPEH